MGVTTYHCILHDARLIFLVAPLGEMPDTPNFIVAWVDYCNKYGMGYALTDGTVGVHFNDSTSLILSPNKW